MNPDKPEWASYEELGRILLEKWGDVLGLELARVEGKQKLVGKSGMQWTVDAKAVRSGDEAILVVECRRYTTSRLKPEAIGALAYRISDVGASGGIVVTPIGVQRGGQLIAEAENIHVVHLDAETTTSGYLLQFLGNVIVGPGPATITLIGACPSSRSPPPRQMHESCCDRPGTAASVRVAIHTPSRYGKGDPGSLRNRL